MQKIKIFSGFLRSVEENVNKFIEQNPYIEVIDFNVTELSNAQIKEKIVLVLRYKTTEINEDRLIHRVALLDQSHNLYEDPSINSKSL